MRTTLQTAAKTPGSVNDENASLVSHEQPGSSARSNVAASWIAQPRIASSSLAWPFILAGGLIAGTVWGINARLWMRYISTDPDFTWGGTLFIIISFAVVGLSQSIAYVARRRIRSRWKLTVVRVGTFFGLIPIFGGAGTLLAPTVLLGALSLSHARWPNWVRGVCVLGAALPPVAVAASVLSDFSLLHTALATLWLIGICAVIVWAAQATLAPQLDRWRPPTLVRLLALACVLPLFLGAGLTLIVGI